MRSWSKTVKSAYTLSEEDEESYVIPPISLDKHGYEFASDIYLLRFFKSSCVKPYLPLANSAPSLASPHNSHVLQQASGDQEKTDGKVSKLIMPSEKASVASPAV